MTFSVKPKALDRLGADFQKLATSTTYAYYNADVDMDVATDGGTAFGLIVAEIDSVRDDLVTAYKSGGNVPVLFQSAGLAIIETADDYRAVDAATRARIDEQMTKLKSVPTGPASDPSRVDLGEYQDDYAPYDYESVAVTPPWVSEIFGWTHPDKVGKATNSFEAYDDFVSIAEDIDYVIGFDWIGDVLGGIGLPDPIKGFRDSLEGDWRAIGRALGALDLVAQQEHAFATDLDTVVEYLPAIWEGNAADRCSAWISSTSQKISDHASDLGQIGMRISTEAIAMKSALDTVCTAIDMLVDLLPDPGDLGDGLLGFVGGVVKTAFKISINAVVKVLELFKIGFDAIMTAAFGIVSIFAQLTRLADSAWPKTPGLNLPDVNGALP